MFAKVKKEITNSALILEVLKITHGFQNSIRPLLVFLIFAVSLYIIGRKLGKQREKPSKLKTIKDLPSFQHFPFWMPSFIETLFGFYKIRKEGVRITCDWWASINHCGFLTVKSPIPAVVITDPILIKQVLTSTLGQFLHKPKILYDTVFTEMSKDGIAASHLNTWRPHRKILNQFFTHRTLPSHLKSINKYGNLLIQQLDTFPQAEVKEFSPILHDKILNIILEILLGEKIMDEMGTRQIPENFRKWKSLVVYRYMNPQYIIPFIWKFNPKRKPYLETISYFINYMKEGISKSRMALKDKQLFDEDESGENVSCIEHMLLHNFSEKEILDEITTLLLGGLETVDATIHFILQHLAEQPNIQRKCQDEIDSLFNSKQNQLELKMDDLTQLKYLEQCILETLRLTPALPIFGRQLTKRAQVGDYLLEKGTILGFSPFITHRHPEIYPEPEKFDPDRFLPENVKARHTYAFIPFSTGPRNCIGWKLALMELKTIISFILRHYDISTGDKFKDVKLVFDISLLPAKEFNLAVHKRNISK